MKPREVSYDKNRADRGPGSAKLKMSRNTIHKEDHRQWDPFRSEYGHLGLSMTTRG